MKNEFMKLSKFSLVFVTVVLAFLSCKKINTVSWVVDSVELYSSKNGVVEIVAEFNFLPKSTTSQLVWNSI